MAGPVNIRLDLYSATRLVWHQRPLLGARDSVGDL